VNYITDKETVLKNGEFIVSKTDLDSKITYGNKYFISISGWEEKELLNKPHNILRHPDMPKVVFKILYEHIKNKKEFFGFIKNLRKDGGFYWVFVNITPSFDSNGKMIGYYSVRRKPKNGFKKIIEPLYETLKNLETQDISKSYDYIKNILKEKNLSFNEFNLNIQKGSINEL